MTLPVVSAPGRVNLIGEHTGLRRRARASGSDPARNHVDARFDARAALAAIAYQVADVLEVLPLEVGSLRADGGARANRVLMQFQADLIGTPVEVASDTEATALGRRHSWVSARVSGGRYRRWRRS